MNYPYHPGSKGPETSAEAADDIASISGHLRKLTTRSYTEVGEDGLTAEETANRVGYPRVSIQPRISELVRLGVLRDSGRRRVNASSGKRAVVWVLAKAVSS